MEKSYITAFKTTAYMSLIVEYLCCFIIFYTWSRDKQLLRFPHITTLIMAIYNFVRVLLLSLPFFFGRSQLMCQFKDDFTGSLSYGGTTFCQIQGSLMHFIFVSILFWLCFSVFNVLVAVLKFSTDNIIKRHPWAVLCLEFIATSILSGALVGVVYAGCSYAPDPFLAYFCLPQGHDTIFYTMTLPAQISSYCAMVMSVFIIRRINRSTALRLSLQTSNSKPSLAQVALSHRFLVLAVVMPLSFVVMYTMLGTYQTFQDEEIANDIASFIRCRYTQDVFGITCVGASSVKGLLITLTILAIYYSVFSSLLVVYSSISAPARAVWTKHFNQIRQRFRRSPNGLQTDTANTSEIHQ
jgi:hypothetical protein